MNAISKTLITVEQIKAAVAEGVKAYFDAGRIEPIAEDERAGLPTADLHIDYLNWAAERGFPVVGTVVAFGMCITSHHPEWSPRLIYVRGKMMQCRAVRWADGVSPPEEARS